ncbi:hypothetical protein C6H64_21610 [Photorhabdus luminescens]|nr:hypothetical protein C6H64_21610 [Photorhabdus luminescens]
MPAVYLQQSDIGWCLTPRVARCLIRPESDITELDGRHLTLASFDGLCGISPPNVGRHKKLNEQLCQLDADPMPTLKK